MRNALIMMVLLYGLFGCASRAPDIPENAQTMASWQAAQMYRTQQRYDLAKQYYQIALSTAQTREAQAALVQELEAITRVIKTLR